MSLEQAIQTNIETSHKLIETINQLISALNNGGASVAPVASTTAKSSNAKAEPEKKSAEPAAKSSETAPADTSQATSTEVSPAEAIDFETLKKSFLALAGKNRDKAVEVLGKFGCGKLTEAKPEQFADIMGAIQEASA